VHFAVKVPHLCEDLLTSVDQPLKIARDKSYGKDFLLCDYNRDGDSYRYAINFCGLQYPFLVLYFIAVVSLRCFDTVS